MRVILDQIALNDSRPIAVRVRPSDEATVSSASYSIIRKEDPPGTSPFDPGAACIVKNDNLGSYIATPTFITFSKTGTFYVKFSITWNDGQIDNTVVAVVPVVDLTIS